MLKNKKAFTLVELLAVIIILGIILVLAVPRITTMINKSRDKAADELKLLIESAAEKYVVFEEITFTGTTHTITLETLQNAGYLKTSIKNPRGGDLSTATVITLTKASNGDITAEVTIPQP